MKREHGNYEYVLGPDGKIVYREIAKSPSLFESVMDMLKPKKRLPTNEVVSRSLNMSIGRAASGNPMMTTNDAERLQDATLEETRALVDFNNDPSNAQKAARLKAANENVYKVSNTIIKKNHKVMHEDHPLRNDPVVNGKKAQIQGKMSRGLLEARGVDYDNMSIPDKRLFDEVINERVSAFRERGQAYSTNISRDLVSSFSKEQNILRELEKKYKK